jgi:DNA gyrase subunit B
LSWVNGGRTYEGGSHVQGVSSVLEEVGLKPSLILIHVIMHNPDFAGPIKTKLNVPHIQEVIKNALRKPLLNYLNI